MRSASDRQWRGLASTTGAPTARREWKSIAGMMTLRNLFRDHEHARPSLLERSGKLDSGSHTLNNLIIVLTANLRQRANACCTGCDRRAPFRATVKHGNRCSRAAQAIEPASRGELLD